MAKVRSTVEAAPDSDEAATDKPGTRTSFPHFGNTSTCLPEETAPDPDEAASDKSMSVFFAAAFALA